MSAGTAKPKVSQHAGVPVGFRYTDRHYDTWIVTGAAFRKPRSNGVDHDWVYPCELEDVAGLVPYQNGKRDIRAGTIYSAWTRAGKPDPKPSASAAPPPPPPEAEPQYVAPDTSHWDAKVAEHKANAKFLEKLLEDQLFFLADAIKQRDRVTREAKEAHEKKLEEHRAKIEAARKLKEEQERKAKEEAERERKEKEKKDREESAKKAQQSWPFDAKAIADQYVAIDNIVKAGDVLSGWWDILGVWKKCNRTEARDAYYRAAKQHHPDKNGSTAGMAKINDAWERAQRYVSYKEKFGSYPY